MPRPLFGGGWPAAHASGRPVLAAVLATLITPALCGLAYAHGVAAGDKGYIQEISGVHLVSFIYLGAKHMMIPEIAPHPGDAR